jgi:hypothetical protein
MHTFRAKSVRLHGGSTRLQGTSLPQLPHLYGACKSIILVRGAPRWLLSSTHLKEYGPWHAKVFLKAQVNKTDRNDAHGIAQRKD